jgi:hypothetical protein
MPGLWKLPGLRKTLRVSSSPLENGAPTPFPSAPTASTTIGYSWCLSIRGRSELSSIRYPLSAIRFPRIRPAQQVLEVPHAGLPPG